MTAIFSKTTHHHWHYYHFMLGAFLPLVRYLIVNRIRNQQLELRDFGPMNRHILNLPYLKTNNVAVSFNKHLSPKKADVILNNLDIIPYNKRGFRPTLKVVKKHLVEHLADESDATDLLLIDRGTSHQTFTNIRHNSGSSRRHVSNMNELYQRIKTDNTKLIQLEDATLKENVSLFYHAKCVLAQHGGALTNAIFMRPHTRIIELGYNRRNHFEYLCKRLNISHQFLGNYRKTAKINVEAAVRKLWRVKLL
jgi:hypothetical protein